MRRGFLYLVAAMDWATRKVLSWRLSNTMEADFCIEALQDALARFGRPEIFNTDQGSQFTSPRFTQVLKDAGVRISMDGKGRWMDNVLIERLSRSMKYEGRLVLDIQIAAQLESGHALGAVAEDGDGQQVIPHLRLATGEDGSAGGAEPVPVSAIPRLIGPREACEAGGSPRSVRRWSRHGRSPGRLPTVGAVWSWPGPCPVPPPTDRS